MYLSQLSENIFQTLHYKFQRQVCDLLHNLPYLEVFQGMHVLLHVFPGKASFSILICSVAIYLLHRYKIEIYPKSFKIKEVFVFEVF